MCGYTMLHNASLQALVVGKRSINRWRRHAMQVSEHQALALARAVTWNYHNPICLSSRRHQLVFTSRRMGKPRKSATTLLPRGC
jgi:hypothetical protein